MTAPGSRKPGAAGTGILLQRRGPGAAGPVALLAGTGSVRPSAHVGRIRCAAALAPSAFVAPRVRRHARPAAAPAA